MVIYTCNKCAKIFGHKNDYNRHLARKNPCTEIFQDIPKVEIPDQKIFQDIPKNTEIIDKIPNISKFDCPHCLKHFSSISNRIKHVNGGHCSIKNKDDTKIELLEHKNKQLEDKLKEIEELLKKGLPIITNTSNNHSHNNTNANNTNANNTNANNTNTNSNNTNTLNNIVNINVFGKEDLSHITNETYKQIFRRCKNSVPAFIKIKHFSSKKPENSNIYISDIKGHYGIMYDGNNWIIEDKQEMLQNLYDINCGLLMDKYEDLKDELDEVTVKKYNRFVETMDESETEHNAKEEIKKILYNEKEKSVSNRKSQKLAKIKK
jgi:uncharacterized C2H2 Zn-finger protein